MEVGVGIKVRACRCRGKKMFLGSVNLSTSYWKDN